MTTKVYDADNVTVSVAGIPLHGYADGEFLTLEMETDMFDDVVGSDGEVSRSKTKDGRATATIKLMQTSDSNDLLSALAAADKLAQNGAGIGAFLVRDRSGRAIYTATECWVKKEPNVSFDRAAKEREWVIRIADMNRFDGGN